MNLTIFNIAVMAGWLMVLVGGCLVHLAGGLLFAGLLLIGLTVYLSRLAGVYTSKKSEGG